MWAGMSIEKLSNMTSDDIVPKTVNLNRSSSLRRSLSTTSLGLMFSTNIHLRDTKSYTGGIEDARNDSSDENEVRTDKLGELMTNKYAIRDNVETIDVSTNGTVLVRTDILRQGGKQYLLSDLAYCWKKDCRIWMWKNCSEMKLNRSVEDRFKAELKKVKDCKY